jgi:hypothetical protein
LRMALGVRIHSSNDRGPSKDVPEINQIQREIGDCEGLAERDGNAEPTFIE